jgi:mono/diheme cytochrome c family protein
MSFWRYPVSVCFVVLILSACGNGENIGGLPVPEAPERQQDAQQIALGEQIFQANCASCHGAGAEGNANWRQRDADGHYPAPPLNGSGHAWHHSIEKLKAAIMNGSPKGQGKMPAWENKLKEQEVEAVIA